MRIKRPRISKATAVAITVAIIGLLAVLWFANNSTTASPVPQPLQKEVNFSVYYPDPTKLPAGYKLVLSSFSSPQSGVIIFKVNAAGGQSVTFSEEAAQSTSVMNNFLSDYIPLHKPIATPLGQAQAGAYNINKTLESVISLPIKNGPWLIATAPADINQSNMNSLVENLTK